MQNQAQKDFESTFTSKGGYSMENRKIEFRSKTCNLHISAYPGHFATKHSHVNYFLDMTTLKIRQSNAEEAAKALVPLYKHNTVVDTIVCLDGTEVIGA